MKAIKRLLLSLIVGTLCYSGVSLGSAIGADAADIHISTSGAWPTYIATLSLTSDSEYASNSEGKAATITANVEGVDKSRVTEWNWWTDRHYAEMSASGDTAVISSIIPWYGSMTTTVYLTIEYLADSVDQIFYTASASIDIELRNNADTSSGYFAVNQVLESSGLYRDQEIAVGGYVVKDDSGSGYTSYEIAGESIGTAPQNGLNTIMLYDGSGAEPSLSLGQYVVVLGVFTEELDRNSPTGFNAQFADGYEVLLSEFCVSRLVSFINGSDADNQCEFKFEIAKAHYIGMDDDEKEAFKEGGDEDVVKARTRYEAWATYLGEDAYPEEVSEAITGIFSDGDSMAYAIVAVTAILALSLAGIGVYLTLKKRKQA